MLNDMINELRLKNDDLVHSLTNQLTYVQDLSTSTKINADAFANFTAVLRDQVIRSHDEFKKIAKRIVA